MNFLKRSCLSSSLIFLLASSAFAEPNIDALKAAFRTGFQSVPVDAVAIQEQLQRYHETPESFLKFFQGLSQVNIRGLYFVRPTMSVNRLGQVEILPQIALEPFSDENFQAAVYMRSLIEYETTSDSVPPR